MNNKTIIKTSIESLLNEVVGEKVVDKELLINSENINNSTKDESTSDLVENHDNVDVSNNKDEIEKEIPSPQVKEEKHTNSNHLDKTIQVKEPDTEIKINKVANTKWFLFAGIFAILVCASIGVCYWYNQYDSVEGKYARANEFFHDGKTSKAIELYTQLAEEEGYTKAKTRLGLLYIFNDSIETDAKKGFKYLKEAAISDSIAMDKLLRLYRGVNAKGKTYNNPENAIYYANMAIKNNMCLSDAYFTLGNAYSDKEDYESAFYYWNKAAKEYQNPGAFGNLGWMFYNGLGCKENNERAFEYFSRAINIRENDDYSLFYLGLMYLNGYGVKKDIMQGKSYIKRSAELGNEDAKKEYARLEMN